MWVVELEQGCWFAPWSGDPGRTLAHENASQYATKKEAERALERAKKRFDFRDFSHAKVVPNV